MFILERLQDRAHCVCELTDLVGADVSTISKHLSVLKHAGIVVSRKEGTTVYYSLACSCLAEMLHGASNIVRNNAVRSGERLAAVGA
jgi:ArsR family transcriptional regulator